MRWPARRRPPATAEILGDALALHAANLQHTPELGVGALRGLQDLGQAHPAYRPAVIDAVCQYLRTPPIPASALVRAAAAECLRQSLGARGSGPGWLGCAVRLPGAVLPTLDLTGAQLRELDLRGATLTGPVTLSHSRIQGPTTLTDT